MITTTSQDVKRIELSDEEGTFASYDYNPNVTEPEYAQEEYEDFAKDVLHDLSGFDIRDAASILSLALELVNDTMCGEGTCSCAAKPEYDEATKASPAQDEAPGTVETSFMQQMREQLNLPEDAMIVELGDLDGLLRMLRQI